IRDSADPVEQEGVRRARQRAAAADLVLWVVDASELPDGGSAPVGGPPVWTVKNKVDLLGSPESVINEREPALSSIGSPVHFYVSATNGLGMNKVIDALSRQAAASLGGEPSLVSRERHRKALTSAL